MRPAAPQEFLAVFGTIYTPTDHVELGTFYRVPDAWDVFGRVPGEYRIELLDEWNNVLADYAFTPSFDHVDPGPVCRESTQEETAGLIAEYVPWEPGTVLIVIYHGEGESAEEIAHRWVSENAPEVTIAYPNGGETLDGSEVEVAWEAHDDDGDDLEFTLEYSLDGGAHWRVLSSGITETELLLDAELVPGTEQGMFRVIASDGVNTGQDESDGTFYVPNKDPQAWIESPLHNAVYIPGQSVALVADSIDLEDGTLGDSALAWTSSLSGTVGAGDMLHVTDFITGTHVITLIATDADGGEATDTVTIHITVLDRAIYLPLVLRES
jgi:hypothetical protein